MNKKISTIDLLLIGTTFIWGNNALFLKIGISNMDFNIYNFIRMMVGAAVCWVFYFFSTKERRIEKKDVFRLILISIFGYFTMLYGFVKGLSYTTSGNAVLIGALVPCFVAVINHFLNIEKLSIKVSIGIIMSFIGVLFISIGSGNKIGLSSTHVLGIVIVLLSQFGVAIYTVFIKDLTDKYTVYQIFPIITSTAAIAFGIICFKDIPKISLSSISFSGWFSIMYTGIASACLGHFVWAWGVKKMGSVKTSLYNNLPPVFGVISGIVFLKEQFGWLQFIGALIIFAGLYTTRTQKDLTHIFTLKRCNATE